MDERRQNNQLEPIYNSFVPIQDIALKTSREQWTIETVAREGQGDSCWQRDMMMMMMMKTNIGHTENLILYSILMISKFTLNHNGNTLNEICIEFSCLSCRTGISTSQRKKERKKMSFFISTLFHNRGNQSPLEENLFTFIFILH